MYRPFTLLIMLIFLFGCVCTAANKLKSKFKVKQVILLSEIALPFTEPSGVAWSDELQSMWVVSGGNQHIYKLDTSGTVVQQIPFIGTDLEGITFDERDSTLWVIDETLKTIFHLNLNGSILLKKILYYPSKKKNKGPEGITLGPEHMIYIVNERKPSLLLQLDAHDSINWSTELNFASDYSDIAYEKSSNSFLILSDKSMAFYSWTKQQGVLCKYVLPNTKNEGIAYDRKRNIVYIVNDSTSKLYYYRSK
jgi:uncharacterized protein YjiK